MNPKLPLITTALTEIRKDMLALVQENSPILAQIHPGNQTSAINLLHYLAFRRQDLRLLQEQGQRPGLGFCRQLVDALFVAGRKTHGEEVAGYLWSQGIRIGSDDARQNCRFGVWGGGPRVHTLL